MTDPKVIKTILDKDLPDDIKEIAIVEAREIAEKGLANFNDVPDIYTFAEWTDTPSGFAFWNNVWDAPLLTNKQQLKNAGHHRFYELLEEMANLHSLKNSDYATTKEPLSNLRRCGRIGIPAYKGIIVRLEDKWDRIERLVEKGKADVKNESLIDTLMDNAVYSLLCIILIEEQSGQTNKTT